MLDYISAIMDNHDVHNRYTSLLINFPPVTRWLAIWPNCSSAILSYPPYMDTNNFDADEMTWKRCIMISQTCTQQLRQVAPGTELYSVTQSPVLFHQTGADKNPQHYSPQQRRRLTSTVWPWCHDICPRYGRRRFQLDVARTRRIIPSPRWIAGQHSSQSHKHKHWTDLTEAPEQRDTRERELMK